MFCGQPSVTIGLQGHIRSRVKSWQGTIKPLTALIEYLKFYQSISKQHLGGYAPGGPVIVVAVLDVEHLNIVTTISFTYAHIAYLLTTYNDIYIFRQLIMN